MAHRRKGPHELVAGVHRGREHVRVVLEDEDQGEPHKTRGSPGGGRCRQDQRHPNENIHMRFSSGPLLGVIVDRDTYMGGSSITGHVDRQFHNISLGA